MKTGVLVLWTVCLAAIALSVLHFAWVASTAERLLVLMLLVTAALFLLRRQK